MKRLENLDNPERAKLLHELLPGSIHGFLDYAKGMATYMQAHKAEVAATWRDQFFTIDGWYELAQAVEKRIDQYGERLSKSSRLFSEQLFGGYSALWSADTLLKFVNQAGFADYNFRDLARTLFGGRKHLKTSTIDFCTPFDELATAAKDFIQSMLSDVKKMDFTGTTNPDEQANKKTKSDLPGCFISEFPIACENVVLQELEEINENEIVVRGYTRTQNPSRLQVNLNHLDSETLLHLANYLSKLP